MVTSPDDPQPTPCEQYEAAPSIMREDLVSSLKILRTNNKQPQLNAFEMFLGLSDRLVKREGDFFRYPHTTKINWAGHHIVSIFTEASGKITLSLEHRAARPARSEGREWRHVPDDAGPEEPHRGARPEGA